MGEQPWHGDPRDIPPMEYTPLTDPTPRHDAGDYGQGGDPTDADLCVPTPELTAGETPSATYEQAAVAAVSRLRILLAAYGTEMTAIDRRELELFLEMPEIAANRFGAVAAATRQAFEQAAEGAPRLPTRQGKSYSCGWYDGVAQYRAAIRALAKEKGG